MNHNHLEFLSDTHAVSEVIGEILLTAIAVIAFSVIAVSVFSYADPQEQVHADIQGWVDVSSDTVYLRHTGGERVDITKTRVLLDINGTRRELSSNELEQIKGSDIWDLGETIKINTSELWSESIGEDDNVALIMLTTDSNLVIKSGTLLGDEQSVGSYSGGGGGGNGTTPTAPILSGQNPLTPYESTTSDTVTFSATSSQLSVNEFLLDGVHLAWSNGTGPSYTSITSAEGTYTVTLLAKNTTDTSLTDSLTWTWTVTAPTPTISTGIDMLLEKVQKGGYIEDGDYLKFRTGGGGSSITIDGSTTSIPNNREVILVMNGQQTTGEMDIGTSGSSRRITTYDFNVDFYLNGVLTDTGDITSIYISKADSLESTLSYYLPSDLSQTYFSENGGSNVIIGWSPNNGSEIKLYNITPTSGTNLRMEFLSGYTYIAGFDSDYTIG